MSIQPVQSFKQMSTPKKVATVAAGVVAVAGVASAAVAYSQGKALVEGKGIKALGQKLKKGYGVIFEAAKEKVSNILSKFKRDKVEEVIDDAAAATDRAAEEI